MTPRLEDLKTFKAQQESKSGSSFSAKENNLVTANVPQKRKMTKATSDKQPPSKRQKDAAPKLVEISHVHSKKNSQNAQNAGSTDKVEDTNLPVETDANIAHSMADSKSKESKPNLYTDQRTAYISNISLEASWLSIN